MANTIYIKSTADGTSPEVEARGSSDSNVDLILTPKGTGRVKSKTETLAYVTELPSVPVKASGAEIDTGTDDAKFATAKAIADSKLSYIDGTETLTNKRITKRVASTASDTTAVIDCDTTDDYYLTAMAGATEISITGTPTNGQTIFIGLKDDGTTRALTWTGITALGVTLPTTTTVSKQHIIGIKYIASAWRAIAVGVEA